MRDPREDERQVISTALGEPVEAAASFRVRWRGDVRGGSLVGVAITFALWVWQRRASRLPATTYLALTPESIWALELRIGPVKVQRIITSWDRLQLTTQASRIDRFGFTLLFDDRAVDLEAVRHDDESERVVALLCQGSPYP